MYILRLESATKAIPNAAALNAACLWVVTGASLLWSVHVGLFQIDTIIRTMLSHPLELFYLSAVTTAVANWIQTKAQKKVTAERASVIYAMDPVWGAIWANILLGETLTGIGMIGALLIIAAAATNAFLDLGQEKLSDTH
jgi:drug/metabolite transporter (DMT)-like permease